MAGDAASSAAAKKCTDILVDKVTKELQYLFCYKRYTADFERKKKDLSAAVESVDVKISEAKRRNETQIEPVVNRWVERANDLIKPVTRPKKWFNFCNDWFSQYLLAKELESMTKEMAEMMEKAENFSQVAHVAEGPGMEFYSQEFMHFKSRNSVFEQLREELKDDNNYRIGLQAMGGSGKTTMAKAVGKEFENSKAFDKVIFIEVPNPVDEKKIRDEIAKKLELKLEDDKDLTEKIWIQIAYAGNVLIILDDVWEELKLENIGIHHGIRTQGRCCVLLTTRYETVCRRMSCQKTIKLGVLPEEDAVNLFLHHATESGKDCPNKLKLLASKVVNECGNLPVIVVAVARTFRNWDPNEWEDAFAAIEKDSSLRHGNNDEEAKKFYNSLKISFKCLDTRAQDLILICSLFPRAYEIPIELLSRIAIGLGLCENVGSYYKARSEVLSIKTTLVRSALLLTAKEGCVKIHDVIRDVVQHIGDEKIQVIMDSQSKLKENIKYSSWMIDDFFNSFESNNLEVLLAWVNANRSLEVPDTFFGGMEGLRVLLLYSEVEFGRKLHLSLPKSVHSLENIQTLSLANWELGDISILQNLKKLQTLELTNCSISELPNEVSQLEKLRLLGLVDCSIAKNNPFEVIGRCLKLEALYYVSNHDTLKINPKPSKIIDLHQEFGIYHVEGNYSFRRSFQLDASIKRYFSSTNLEGILSESTVKSLVARAEILELTECNEARWANLIPDMVHPKENDGMNDLLRLSLESWPAIQCLINTSGIQSNTTIFSNLVELRLYNMHVRELCHGHPPNDFLKQLEKLDLNDCGELDGTLFKGKLELSNLKSIALNACSMTCLFHLPAAQSLRQLENLHIEGCSKLKCLISDDVKSTEQKVDDHQDPNQKIHHLMFPKLKFFKVEECHALKFIFPIFPCKELESVIVDGCNELRYIFGQCLEEGGMYQMEKETILPLLQEIDIANVPKFVNIYPEHYLPQPSQVQKSWDPLCCLSSKASALSIDEPSFFKGNQLGHTQALKEKHLGRADGLFTPPLYPYKNLRKMSIEGFSELKSLLTLSIASSLNLLEELTISECGEMEHIVTDEGHVYNHMNDCYIFSNLKELEVFNAEKLKYVFGICHSNQWHNVHIELNLLNLKSLCLHDVPNMVSICTKNYSVKALSLQDIHLENCPQLLINTIMDLAVEAQKREDLSKKKEKGKKEFTCLYLTKASKAKHVPSTAQRYFPLPLYQSNLRKIEITGFSKLTSLFTISIASSLKFLETLYVKRCDMLEHIITDEGANGQGHMNVHSIFPNLQQIHISSCNNLEYVFPAFYSKDFRELGSVSIQKAEKMKYVFRECHADQNHNVQSKLNLLALKRIYLVDLPNMVSICTENYYVEVLHLEYIRIEGCPQLPQTFIDLLVGGHKTQEDLSRRKALSFKEKGKALSNLQELPDLSDIYVGSKNSLSFRNLSGLTFVGCKQLKFILSASTTRSIPELRRLFISDCEELVSIIEDDEENQQNPLDLHQPCFPKLCSIRVKHCKKLKCLFSISTCAKLPCLLLLEIEDAPELEQVFEWMQGAPQELVIKDVLPNLLAIRLVKLPSLHTIYHGIDFQTVKIRIVQDCNNIPSPNVISSEIFDYVNYSLTQEKMNFEDDHDFLYTCHVIYSWADERKREESKEAREIDNTISEQSSSTRDQADSEEPSNEAVEKDSAIQKQKTSSPNLTEIEEEGSEDVGNDSAMPQQSNGSPNFENSASASGNEIIEEKLSATLSSNSDVNTKVSTNEIVEEQIPTSNTAVTPPSKSDRELCEKESMGDQQALGESRSSYKAPQRVEEPTNEYPSKETSDEMALTIPESVTGMNPPLISSICSPKKPQNETSAAHVKMESGSSTITDPFERITNASANEIVEEKLFTTPLSNSDMNLKATFREGPSLEKYDKASSSTYSKPKIGKPYTLDISKELCGKEMDDQQALGESRSSNKATQRVEEPTNECSFKETSNEMALWIPPFVTGMTSPLISSISSPKKPQVAASTTHMEMESGSCAVTDQSAQGQIMVNQKETSIDDDLIRLLRIMKDGTDLEVGLPSISKLAALEDDKAAKAFVDIESSLKMDLHQIANSEEHTNRLENALNFLSTHFSEEESSSHGLIRGKTDSLHQEIRRILSSFNQASDNLDKFTKLKEKEKWIDEQHSQRMEEATTLVSEICNTEDYMIKLKEQITSLQDELKSKEEEFEDGKIKLSSLRKQKKECVLDTIGFMEEYEAVKKDKSYVVDGQRKASQELKKVENQWPSCVAELRKTVLLLGILFQQKL